MFDTHCHLDAEEYDRDRTDVILRAKASGVVGILVPGWSVEHWPNLLPLCAHDDTLRCGVGLHPWYLHTLTKDTLHQALARLPQQCESARAVAVGECGLDGPLAKRGGADLACQEAVLVEHVHVARALHLPLILHCVGAHERLLRLLKREGPLPSGGVLHSYSGSKELIPEYLKLGLSFSFAGIVTRANAHRPRAALAAVPLSHLLVESDGPDQAAQDVLPRRSEPAHVRLVLEAAATLRGECFAELCQATTHNAQRLFALIS